MRLSGIAHESPQGPLMPQRGAAPTERRPPGWLLQRRRHSRMRHPALIASAGLTLLLLATHGLAADTSAAKPDYLFNDSHFHLTNYVQQGPTMQQFLAIMGDEVGRVAIFGIP